MAGANSLDIEDKVIILAGATGSLGERIAYYLLKQGAQVRALVRPASDGQKVAKLRSAGVLVVEVDFNNTQELAAACSGGACLVSALSGLRRVIVDVQRHLLEAALAAGVPRFIPSDFSIDFTKLSLGSNRNLDLRQEFRYKLDDAPIAATSILNGMFMDLLTGDAPLVLFPLRRVLYWGDPDQPLDFTTMENTAQYTAAAALDSDTPRDLRIAGEALSPRGLRDAASLASGRQFKLFRVGGLKALDTMIKVTRTLYPARNEVFPPWQGMQYMRNMFSGRPKLSPLDNDRYPHILWTSVKEVLEAR